MDYLVSYDTKEIYFDFEYEVGFVFTPAPGVANYNIQYIEDNPIKVIYQPGSGSEKDHTDLIDDLTIYGDDENICKFSIYSRASVFADLHIPTYWNVKTASNTRRALIKPFKCNVDDIRITIQQNIKFIIVTWDEGYGNFDYGGWLLQKSVNLRNMRGRYFAFFIARIDDAVFNENELPNISIKIEISKIYDNLDIDKLTGCEGNLALLDYTQSGTGVITTHNGLWNANPDYSYTQFLPVKPGEKYLASLTIGGNLTSNNAAGIAGYNKNKQYVRAIFDNDIAGSPSAGRVSYHGVVFEVPPGVYFIRMCSAFQNTIGAQEPFLRIYSIKDYIHAKFMPIDTQIDTRIVTGSENIKKVYTNGHFIHVYNPYSLGCSSPLSGQIHIHTTNSDGAFSPAVTMQKMKGAGYDFVTITDHSVITPNPGVNDLIWLCDSYEDTRASFHANIFNAKTIFVVSDINTLTQQAFDNGNSLIMLNHPDYPYAYQTGEMLRGVNKGISFVEVFNATTDSSDRGLDILLSNGHRCFATAVDDYHNDGHLKKGWIIVFADSRRPGDILFSMLTGRFFATTGFVVENVQLLGNIIQIQTGSINATTIFMGENMSVLKTVAGQIAEYEITGDELFVRAVIQQGNAKCWVQPFFILTKEKPLI